MVVAQVQSDHDRKPEVPQAAVYYEGRRGRGRTAEGARFIYRMTDVL